MPSKSVAVSLGGIILLAIGLFLALERMRLLYPGLVILVGCVVLAVVLLVHEMTRPRAE